MTALSLGVLRLALAFAQPEVTVAQIVDQHCVRCHGDDSVLDLRSLPPRSATRTWMKILEMVDTARMPPPPRQAGIADRFPLDPAVRRTLVSAITSLLGGAMDPPPTVRHVATRVWTSVVEEWVGPLLSPQKLGELLAPLRGFGGAINEEVLLPQHLLLLDAVSRNLCGEVFETDAARATSDRRFLAAVTSPGSSAAPSRRVLRQLAADLRARLFVEQSTARELDQGVEVLSHALRRGGRLRDAWVAFCASELAGPRLLYLSYAGRP